MTVIGAGLSKRAREGEGRARRAVTWVIAGKGDVSRAGGSALFGLAGQRAHRVGARHRVHADPRHAGEQRDQHGNMTGFDETIAL